MSTEKSLTEESVRKIFFITPHLALFVNNVF